MDTPTLDSRTRPFPVLGVLVGIYHFYQILIEHSVSKQHYAVSDPGLHCLPMSHIKGARLIWINGKKLIAR